MTHPSPIDQEARRLVVAAGGYLHNIVREPGVTCLICATPVGAGYQLCLGCQQAAAIPGRADIVVPLTYVIARAQSGLMMRQYKDDPSPQVRDGHTKVIRRLLYLGIAGHQRCVERVVGQPVNRRLAIPSSAGRAGEHPFIALATAMRAVDGSPALARTGTPVGERAVSAARFAARPPGTRFDGEHVMLLDDTWTTGSRTQSAAVLLRQLGATHVSIMVVARWLDRGWAPSQAFINSRLTSAFDPYRCPVTGTTCP